MKPNIIKSLPKQLCTAMGFSPKEGVADVFQKQYSQHSNYIIEIDYKQQCIDYGEEIKTQNKSTQNFSQAENWVVLECVNRLLEQGYKPKNIILEKTWPSGHGTSGRLDICIMCDKDTEYLLIECKTYGREFDKAYSRIKKDGGQLFTYFKFSNKAKLIMLYASQLSKNEIIYRNEIIKIEEDYRSGGVEDFYDKWNKLTKDNGVFDLHVKPYNYTSKALTPNLLKPIKQEDSSFIFNRFLEILRHNVVSDKPNAFNKIFTLFLCKIYDEKTTPKNKELQFQWKEGVDNNITFQIRLTDLYKNGMKEFLEKTVTDFSESDFETKYKNLDENTKKALLQDIKKLRLEKNNEFAIKEVFDEKSFTENAKVVKQVVELLQGFKIRYTKKQQYLSDFFELLLTTGLKQESGQFFTPLPIAQFIIKSMPIDDLIDEKLTRGKRDDLLPYVIDYAAGSGHFLTEMMHEVQCMLDKKDPATFIKDTAKKIKNWQEDHFDWAFQYVYGIEKDYRLVKVGKVGCYLHGDGLANVVHSDGLGAFKKTEEYKDKLDSIDKDFPKENKQFDIVMSNPPYSVHSFKQNACDYYTENDFELYEKLTDKSKEIECLFIERTSQLLKDGGIAGIILPRTIISNAGIYAQARELILKHFDIIAIAELGGNTFMAAGTNTVTLFLRRRNNYISSHIKSSVQQFFTTYQDVTVQGIEKPFSTYVRHTWASVLFEDYKTLVQRHPNRTIQEHELYKEYQKKLNANNKETMFDKIISIEADKLLYFILSYNQKVVLINSGEKTAEKQFLGYAFSNRRGSEGIHPTQGGKSIDECTHLFDPDIFDNPKKASTYIYKAFKGDVDFPIDESLKKNITRMNVVDMLIFDRSDFDKQISTTPTTRSAEKKSNYDMVRLGDVITIYNGKRQPITERNREKGAYPYYGATGIIDYIDNFIFDEDLILIGEDGAKWGTGEKCAFIARGKYWVNNHAHVFKPRNEKLLYIYTVEILNYLDLNSYITGYAPKKLNQLNLRNITIPLPPLETQRKIVAECEKVDEAAQAATETIARLKTEIADIVQEVISTEKNIVRLGDICEIQAGGTPKTNVKEYWENGTINWATLADTKEKYLFDTQRKITKEGLKNSTAQLLPINTVLFSSRATIGDISIMKVPTCTNQGYKNFICNENELYYEFLYYILKNQAQEIKNLASGMTYPEVSKDIMSNLKIPLPPLETQHEIVQRIEHKENDIRSLSPKIQNAKNKKNTLLEKYLYE